MNIVVLQCLIYIFSFIVGKIGITYINGWCEPVTLQDVDACDRYQQFWVSYIQNKM
jgi:hypothetical protein